ncbi:MAG TPA: hypothetical protein VFJ53_04245, partial [Solirubrobacterales bacterium]|nr:hypothetical protein [Solirubrobacterales bacterium]
DEGRFSFRGLAAAEVGAEALPHAVAWNTAAEKHLRWGLQLDAGRPVDSVARLLAGSGAEVEWRHAPAGPGGKQGAPSGWIEAGELGPEATANAMVVPLLPGSGRYSVARWEKTMTWIPPLSTVLVRYLEPLRDHRIVTNNLPPYGYAVERHLGALRSTAFEGCERLVRIGTEFHTFPRGEWQPLPEDGQELGYLEMAPLPQLRALALGVHRPSGEQVLVTLPDDPLLGDVDLIRTLGFVDPLPIEPTFEPPGQPGHGLVGLLKTVDLEARRHRYAIGEVPAGQLVGELGGLAETEFGGAISAWIVDGKLVTALHAPPAVGKRPLSALRWTIEPAMWRGLAPKGAQAKSALRRSAIAAANLSGRIPPPPPPDGEPEAWLFGELRPSLSPLYASYHPVTGDQLLTRGPADAAQMGYEGTTLLGFVRQIAPLTGSIAQAVFPVPWARRFGAVPREG